MIIKGNRLHKNRLHKTNFAEKVGYIESDKGRSQEGEVFTIYQNIANRSPAGAIQAFQKNDGYRKRVKNGVVIYHDILSFKEEDSKYLNQAILRDLTQEYISKRAGNAVVYAKPHIHNSNIHVHILISGTEYRSKKTLRLDNRAFMKVRRDLEKYQLEHYPHLTHSVVYQQSKARMKQKDRDQHSRKQNEYEAQKRGGVMDKEQAKQILSACYREAQDEQEFYKALEGKGLTTYTRGKRAERQGITLNNRHYRFGTLGIDRDKMKELKERKEKQATYAKLLDRYSIKYKGQKKEEDKEMDY